MVVFADKFILTEAKPDFTSLIDELIALVNIGVKDTNRDSICDQP